MIPRKLAPYILALILSGGMSFLVSGVATFRALGMVDGFLMLWLFAWIPSWAIAFPALVILRPPVTKLVERFSAKDK